MTDHLFEFEQPWPRGRVRMDGRCSDRIRTERRRDGHRFEDLPPRSSPVVVELEGGKAAERTLLHLTRGFAAETLAIKSRQHRPNRGAQQPG